MPGEFEKHAGCYIIWPERPDNWRLGAKPAQKAFVDVATAISHFEPVTVVASSSQYVNARYMLSDEIRVVEMDNDDAWVRDSGPTFVVNDSGDVRGVDWSFNSWGDWSMVCTSRGIKMIKSLKNMRIRAKRSLSLS